MKKIEIDPREFIKTWQTSATVSDVARKFKADPSALSVRACRYRAKGIALKQMPRGRHPYSLDSLKRYAESF